MIAVGSKFKKEKGSALLATDTRTNKPIYYISDGPYPKQKIRGNPLNLVNQEELLKCFKKYGLKKDEINKLLAFYRDPDTTSIEIADDFKLRLCFQKLEDLMLRALKTIWIDPLSDIQVWHDPNFLQSVAMIGQSGSGKTFLAAKILMREIFSRIKVYVFTQNPEDPSIQMLKSRGKYTVIVDLEKINSPLKLNRDVSPSSILLFDDIFELRRENTKGREVSLRKNLIDLCNEAMTRGRHHKKKGSKRGTSVIICAHQFKNGFASKVLWSELAGGLYVYPSSSPHKITDFLVKSIGIHKTDLEQITKFAEGSRWICFKISGRPLYAAWKTGVYLL